jgi:putative oxidoreductase
MINKVLWAAQVLVALPFLMAGSAKLMTAPEVLAADMAWVEHVPAAAVKLIGLLEVLGAMGLVLPSALRFKPWLTPLAAAGLVLTMVCAAGLHISLGEGSLIGPNIVLGGIAAFIAWGRYKKAPIGSRQRTRPASTRLRMR